ncbi:MAG: DUF1349 domain-containing protein [Cyanobacteria bacterium P01_G01_bin.67]
MTMQWHNEPPNWSEQDNFLQMTSGFKTDFWRKTHYGFIRDTGHFRYQTITGNFMAKVKITGQYHALYDQAGLMIREDETTWLKCSVEFVDGTQYASTVVTRDYSDWSIVQLPSNPESLWLKLERQDETIKTACSLDGEQYNMMRLAYLTITETVQVGLMCASPREKAFRLFLLIGKFNKIVFFS